MDRIRLIASDMDATLLDEYSQLPPKFTETIRALAGQGILFAAASGRPLYTLETMFPDLLEEIILIGDNDDSQKAFDRIYGAFHTGNGGAFSVAVAGRNWVDVMNPGVHKGAALAKVGALLGIPADSMMAFGDTYNDAEMLTTAKYGFLMENGSGPLRAQVPFLAPSHREYGVMQVLKQVLRQNGEVSPEDFVKAHGDVTI